MNENQNFDPLEYCDVCFYRGKTNLCETYKGTFTKISPIHFSQQNKLEKILNGLGVRSRLVERRWTCILDRSQRNDFLDSLWGIGVTVHTLEDHVKILTKLYKPDVRNLGPLTQIELPTSDSWKAFDPANHDWKELEIAKKQDKFVTKVKLGAVLKRTDPEGEIYFRTISSGGVPSVVPVEKRAAYNMIVTQLEPSKAYWYVDKTNRVGFIKSKYLENLPEEISSTLTRLQYVEKPIGEFLSFDNDDFKLVKSIIALTKIELERSSEVISIDVDEKKKTSSVLIDNVEKDRLTALSAMINELGGKIERDNEQLKITGKLGFVNLKFTQSEKSTQEGQQIAISLEALEDPQRVTELLSLIKKRLGLLGMSIENLVCRYWPVINEADLQYTVHSIIEYSKMDKNLALSVITDDKKFEKVNRWNSKIKEGKTRSSLDTITLGRILKLRKS